MKLFFFKKLSILLISAADNKILDEFLNHPTSAVLEVYMDPEQGFLPKVKGVLKEDNTILAPPIEEMSPLISQEKLKTSMLVNLSEKSNQIKRW